MIDDDDAVRESLAFLLATRRDRGARPTNRAVAFLDVAPERQARLRHHRRENAGASAASTCLRRLHELKLGVPVIVITGHGDVPLAVEAMKIGAVDFLEKPFDDEVLLAAVRSALNQLRPRQQAPGRTRRDRRAGWRRCRTASARCSKASWPATPTRQIAYDLGISPRTVEIYRANLMTKMQAASLSDLVRMALIAGHCSGRNGPKSS